ncbi:MAG: NFACT family protein [Clostridia bacterium]|nr:NFACT family protein [Clostridia bacterium]
MAFDGGFLKKVLGELNQALDSHIDKIYQPSRDELVLLLRKKGFAKRLYINVKTGSVRLHFTESRPENPAVPPNFCMLLRKYISSAKLVKITQPSLERVAEFHFSASNEMGDIENYRLVCEMIGAKANIILLRENGRIVDALKHSDVETAKRYILPNAVYEYPEREEKLNPIENKAEILKDLSKDTPDLAKKLLNRAEGFSPLICREIEHKAQALGLETAYDGCLADLKEDILPVMVLKPDGTPFDYSYTKIEQYGTGYDNKICDSFSVLLDEFYLEKDNLSRINNAARDIIKLVKNLKDRTARRLALRLEELKKCENRETFRIYGELIKANLYRLKSGDSEAEVENYYDENLSVIKIPLNPALSPSKNADRYFKEYKKTYTAAEALTKFTEEDRLELVYFDSVLESIERCSSVSEICEIREELYDAGYIKRPLQKGAKKKETLKPLEFTSAEGYRILVGKNNTQNDYLTTKFAAKNDLWFHTKDIPGSHVIVMCGGKEVSDDTILFAASLAAKNSKAKESSQVPVDYTPVKFVKKPNGAKAGMVIYTTNKTVYVDPKKI